MKLEVYDLNTGQGIPQERADKVLRHVTDGKSVEAHVAHITEEIVKSYETKLEPTLAPTNFDLSGITYKKDDDTYQHAQFSDQHEMQSSYPDIHNTTEGYAKIQHYLNLAFDATKSLSEQGLAARVRATPVPTSHASTPRSTPTTSNPTPIAASPTPQAPERRRAENRSPHTHTESQQPQPTGDGPTLPPDTPTSPEVVAPPPNTPVSLQEEPEVPQPPMAETAERAHQVGMRVVLEPQTPPETRNFSRDSLRPDEDSRAEASRILRRRIAQPKPGQLPGDNAPSLRMERRVPGAPRHVPGGPPKAARRTRPPTTRPQAAPARPQPAPTSEATRASRSQPTTAPPLLIATQGITLTESDMRASSRDLDRMLQGNRETQAKAIKILMERGQISQRELSRIDDDAALLSFARTKAKA
ncbi:MAG: hypothetical protein MRY21_08285 [Simkaniaceae bacterium]|nr:hypothetical protein [Simkaniaceae bacterium]